jgi:cytochrome c oxidase assembly protein subunit 11
MQKKLKTLNSRNFVFYLVSLGVLMLGISYVSVPFYQIFCQTYGLNGGRSPIKPIETEANTWTEAKAELIDKNPVVTIHFDTDSGTKKQELPWLLKANVSKIKIYPGDTSLVFYTVQNLSKETQIGIATYNIIPAKAGVYFSKIQCFCFEEQRLKGNEKIELPVLFFLDSDFSSDPKMKDVSSITLSYTFHKTTV